MPVFNYPRDWDFTKVRRLFEQQPILNWPGDWNFSEVEKFKEAYSPEFDFSWHLQDPFDPVFHPAYRVPLPNRKATGVGLMVLGTGMLIPGPFDLLVAGAGAYIAGPPGAVGAVLLYNITAVGLIAVGYLMVTH